MTQVTVVTEDGGTQTVNIPSDEVTLRVGSGPGDASAFTPAVVRNIEVEQDGETESVTDQCGRTETQRRGDKTWRVTIDGIVTRGVYFSSGFGESHVSNLRLQDMRVIGAFDYIKLESDIWSGEVVVDNIVISKSNDLVSVNIGDEDRTAYEFQLQLKEPETEASEPPGTDSSSAIAEQGGTTGARFTSR